MSGTETELDLDLNEEEVEEETETVTEPTVEELKASVAKLERAVAKANKEAAKLRNEKKEPKVEETEAPTRYKQSAVTAAARAELREAGFTGTREQAAKLSRLLNLDDLDVDDDGEVDGLEDAVADLKDEFPALFGTAPVQETKPKTPKVDAANRAPQSSIKTSVDKVAEDRWNRMFGSPTRKGRR